jgi:hypothetical protein
VKRALWWIAVLGLAAGGLYCYHNLYNHAVDHEWIKAAFSFTGMVGWWAVAVIVGIHRGTGNEINPRPHAPL